MQSAIVAAEKLGISGEFEESIPPRLKRLREKLIAGAKVVPQGLKPRSFY